MSATGSAHSPINARNNFAYLAAALVLLLLGLALSHELGLAAGQIAVQAAMMAVLGVGILSLRGRHRWYGTRVGLWGATLLLFALGWWLGHREFQVAWLGFMLFYVIMTAWSAMRLVLFSGAVDNNKIIGSFCVFLLLGVIWATLYAILVEYRADFFHGLETAGWHQSFPDLLYFSFVTLTTLGYGDITPATPLTRFLAFMEAIVGQFYLAVLVASLVGMGVSNRHRTPSSTRDHD